MSFIDNLKKSLGFGNDVDDELLADSEETVVEQDEAMSQETQAEMPVVAPGVMEVDRQKADMIFARVVGVFNEALPPFLRESIDTDAQRKLLYDGLDQSLKDYLTYLETEAMRRCEANWAAEQAAMRNEMDSLRNKAKEIEQQRFDIKQQQLSSDRQKRALTDRLHDLEANIGRLEAEREQYDLENKSLLNKLKVAGIHESEVEKLSKQLADAQAEILRLRTGSAVSEPQDESRLSELEATNKSLNEQLEAASDKDRIATEMLNGLQSKAAEMREENERLKSEIETLTKKLVEAESYKSEVAEISKQIAQVEDVIDRRDRKIEKLRAANAQLREENESLKETISHNLKTHSEAEEKLKQRIEALEADPMSPLVTEDLESEIDKAVEKAAENDAVKISDGDLAAIEESFDSADWMRTDPPETPSMRSGVSEAEFGYQAPVRKTPRQDNDAQLSLF